MSDALFQEASMEAARVDSAFLLLIGIASAIFIVVFGVVLFFAIRYRRGSNAERGAMPKLMASEIEIGWTAGTAFLAFFLFFWGVARPFAIPHDDAPPLEIHVYAKQWMWKVEHDTGAREINTLHVPADTPIHLVMTSQDAIHSFYVPAFRLKEDVLPGRDTILDFHATQAGTFHLFCAEYCGTEHSAMTGEIVVMSRQDYASWRGVQPHTDSLAAEGEALFRAFGCSGCHDPGSAVHAPDLRGIFGRRIPLTGGGFVIADEAYLRDSILLPQKDVAAGYAPIMPSFSNVADESQIARLIAYIKSLSAGAAPP